MNIDTKLIGKIVTFFKNNPSVIYKGLPVLIFAYTTFPILIFAWSWAPWVWMSYEFYKKIPHDVLKKIWKEIETYLEIKNIVNK